MVEQVGHEVCQRKKTGGYAGNEAHEEGAVYLFPETFELSLEEQGDIGRNVFYGSDKPFVNAGNECNGSSRYAGNDIGGSHGNAFGKK